MTGKSFTGMLSLKKTKQSVCACMRACAHVCVLYSLIYWAKFVTKGYHYIRIIKHLSIFAGGDISIEYKFYYFRG